MPLSRWERVSRIAGVVRGTDWDDRLDRFIRTEHATIAAQQGSDAPQQGRIDNAHRQIETAENLNSFVGGLRRRLADGAAEPTWSGLGGWALDLFHDIYGGETDLGRLPGRGAVRRGGD